MENETLLVLLLTVREDGMIMDMGDTVVDRLSGRSGVLQSVHNNGMITVAMGPGRVAVARPETFGLSVSGLATCGCAATLARESVYVPGNRCASPVHQGSRTNPPTVPQLDDLI